jgi:hypothetical protein
VTTTLPNKLLFYEIYTLKESCTTYIFSFLLKSYFIRHVTGTTCFVLITSGISTRFSAQINAEIELGDSFLPSQNLLFFIKKENKKMRLNVSKLTILSSAIQNVRIISKLSLSIAIRNNYTVRGHNLWAVPEYRKWFKITELTVILTVTKHKKDNLKKKLVETLDFMNV